MTCLLGINMGQYALIAADKMESYVEEDEIVYSNNDADKIVSTGLGLITGAGFAYTLENVKELASSSDIFHTDQLMEIIQEERKELLKIINENDFNESIYMNTCWLFTYRTGDRGYESDDFDNQKIIIRLALYHPGMNPDVFINQDSQPIIIFPTDIKPDRMTYYQSILLQNIKSLDEIPDGPNNLAYNAALVIKIIDDISKETKTVSPNCDIGVTFIDGVNGLSANMSVNSNGFNFKPLD